MTHLIAIPSFALPMEGMTCLISLNDRSRRLTLHSEVDPQNHAICSFSPEKCGFLKWVEAELECLATENELALRLVSCHFSAGSIEDNEIIGAVLMYNQMMTRSRFDSEPTDVCA
jgi:hypothetical protein